ncbi:biotin/lipoyl-containing protein, partial [Sinorhizobium fredii]|uniref:biotin/lipoyl-containing protein n=1 Tax=Rhizobium fredii TaxID=380 RepID=UPI0005B4042F
MPINITMPALSPTMEEGNLAKWLVKEGDKVKSGDVIAEIETDKATMEVEAVDEGTVAKIVVPAGTEGVKVNALIAVLAADGEDVATAAKGGNGAAAPASAAKAEAAAPAAPAASTAPAAPAQAAGEGKRVFSSPLARRLAKEAGIDLSAIAGSGPYGRVVKKDVESAVSGGTAKP